MSPVPNQDAENHLAQCATCFTWLEQRDPLVEALQRGRPDFGVAPAALTPRIMAAWHSGGFSWRFVLVACGALFLTAAFAVALAGYTYPGVIAAFLAPAVWLAGLIEDVIGTLSVLAGLLFDNPALLASYLIATIAICSLWARLYRTLQPVRRIAA